MSNRLMDLRRRIAEQTEALGAILDGAQADDRAELSEEETAAYAEGEAHLASLQGMLERAEAQAERERRLTSNVFEVSPGGRIEGGGPAHPPGEVWESFGHQLRAIYEAGLPSPRGRIDPRLLMPDEKAAATGGGTAVGSDAGFLVRTEYSREIFRRAYELGALSSRCDAISLGDDADELSVPYIEETSRATGSRWGGVQVYRRSEADTVTATRPKIGEMNTRLEDLMGLAYATERLLRDAASMSQVYMTAFSEEFAFELDDEIWSGTGAGECLGIMNSGAIVSVAKVSGQVADTVVAGNVTDMFAALWPRSQASAVWFVNQEVLAQLPRMVIGDMPVYLPPGGLSGTGLGSMYGRPVITIEHAEKLGDKGDIMLADLSQYQLVNKDGVQQAESIHVRFIYNERAFRWVMRVNGQPKWKTSLTPYKANSGFKTSPFITLDARG